SHVDEVRAQSDNKIDGSELDDGTAQPPQLLPWEGELAVGKQHNQNSGDAEDRTRRARAGNQEEVMIVAEIVGKHVAAHAEQIAGRACNHIDSDHAPWADQWFTEDTEVP